MGNLIVSIIKVAINVLLFPLLAVVWLVSAFTGWLLKESVRVHVRRSVEYAVGKGVPSDFAIKMIDDRCNIKEIVQQLGKLDPAFKTKDVYEQYGLAIVDIYKDAHQNNPPNGDTLPVAKKIKEIITPQIVALENSGYRVHIDDVTYMYVTALAFTIEKKPYSLDQIKELIKYTFPVESHSFSINDAHYFAGASSSFSKNCGALMPLAAKEIEAGKGQFYLKYTEKILEEIEKMLCSSGDFDPTKVKAEEIDPFFGLI